MTQTAGPQPKAPAIHLISLLMTVLVAAVWGRSVGWNVSSQTVVSSNRGLTGGAGVASSVNRVGDVCTVTLSGRGATARLLGQTLTLGVIRDGRATLDLGSRTASCRQGDDVAAGPLTLRCTAVSGQTVVLTTVSR